MSGRRIGALIVILLAIGLGYLNYLAETDSSSAFNLLPKFKLGLDLRGGSHLVYEADPAEIAKLPSGEVSGAMISLREVIERRINAFGVAEPVIQIESVGLGDTARERLVVELPGVTDVAEAIKLIKVTPLLEFKTVQEKGFGDTALSGRYLKRAQVVFNQNSISPAISIEFDSAGAEIFAKLTRENVGSPLAIFLDGAPISAPVVREEIRDGKAEISGQFTLQEARDLARNLNLGALPVPISLVSTETIGATLGGDTLNHGIRAGLIGLVVVALFMLFWYRLPGLVSVVALAIYVVLILTVFRLVGVTLTAAGIAGLVLSFGIALDANVLIFERLKEELKSGHHLAEAVHSGFSKAWLAIRDSNFSSLISAVILFWFGTSLIKGFALTLSLGIIVSMLTAISVTRTFLLALTPSHAGGLAKFLFKSGFK